MLEGNDGEWRNISDRSSPAERRVILLFDRGRVPLRSGGVVGEIRSETRRNGYFKNIYNYPEILELDLDKHALTWSRTKLPCFRIGLHQSRIDCDTTGQIGFICHAERSVAPERGGGALDSERFVKIA